MKKLISVVSLLLVILLAACTEAPQDTLPRSRLVVSLLDLSGSFAFVGESVGKMAGTVDEIGPGDEFVARAIDGSNSGQHILQAKLPRSTRTIDPTNRRRVYTMKLQMKQMLRRINTKHSSRKTDLMGPIYTASLLFQKAPDKQKYLLLFTDMEDNAGQTIPSGSLNLRGVKVIAFFVSPGSIQEDFRLRRKWASFFSEAGASFEMLTVSESRSRSPVLMPGGGR